MRVFWGLVAVLVLIAVGIPMVSAYSAREKERERAAAEKARLTSNTDSTRDTTPRAPAPSVAVDARADDSAPPPTPATTPTQPRTEPIAGASPTVEPPATPAPEEPAAPTPGEPPPLTPAPAATAAAPEPAVESGTAAPGAAAVPPAAAGDTPAAPDTPKVVARDDGSMLVDDRFVVKGKGTAESPYEVSWEMLVSANETYDPRLGRKKIPARITMLDGKRVRLTGYVAYPMFVEQPRELLSMLNQWDGCCIGVPPTPFDAVEVHLENPVSKEDRLATFGAVEGKFFVKPYLAGDWLVGLYVMENSDLKVKEYNGAGT